MKIVSITSGHPTPWYEVECKCGFVGLSTDGDRYRCAVCGRQCPLEMLFDDLMRRWSDEVAGDVASEMLKKGPEDGRR